MLAPNEDIKIPAILTTLLKCHAVCVYLCVFFTLLLCLHGNCNEAIFGHFVMLLKKRRNIPSPAKHHQMRKYVDCR